MKTITLYATIPCGLKPASSYSRIMSQNMAPNYLKTQSAGTLFILELPAQSQSLRPHWATVGAAWEQSINNCGRNFRKHRVKSSFFRLNAKHLCTLLKAEFERTQSQPQFWKRLGIMWSFAISLNSVFIKAYKLQILKVKHFIGFRKLFDSNKTCHESWDRPLQPQH